MRSAARRITTGSTSARSWPSASCSATRTGLNMCAVASDEDRRRLNAQRTRRPGHWPGAVVPCELLTVMREAIGSAVPAPNDRVREDELKIVPFIETQVGLSFRPLAIERLLRVTGESMRRIAEQEADWWRTEVIEPAFA